MSLDRAKTISIGFYFIVTVFKFNVCEIIHIGMYSYRSLFSFIVYLLFKSTTVDCPKRSPENLANQVKFIRLTAVKQKQY